VGGQIHRDVLAAEAPRLVGGNLEGHGGTVRFDAGILDGLAGFPGQDRGDDLPFGRNGLGRRGQDRPASCAYTGCSV
jgi:hypothetical protein